jgi:hypothetical protein
MTVEDAVRLLKIKVRVHKPGEPKYRIDEGGYKIRIFEAEERLATPEDVLKWDEAKGTLVMIDGKKYNIFE